MEIITENSILKSFVKQVAQIENLDEETLHKQKKRFAKEHSCALPSNFQLQSAYKELLAEGWEGNDSVQRLMRKRKIRTLSGVSVITVLTKPYHCPGQCVFCPTEPGMPKSYLSNEPGAMRAVLDDFHPKDQVATRIDSLTRQGHETDKIEMIVLGGTFSAYNKRYRTDFVRALYNACNEKKGASLEDAQTNNETASHRIIGLSLETRPDHITKEEIAYMRQLGCTKVQIGVQHTDNEILALNKRGETIEDVAAAMKLMRDAGFKIAAHLMPNLPGSTIEKDLAMVKEFFTDSRFKPDQLKLYPCVVTPYAELEQWWKEGRYKSYSDEELMNLLIEMQLMLPEYVRLERLFRDIPGETILEGSQKTNMRQLLNDKMKASGLRPRDIRYREIKGESYDPSQTECVVREFDASDGKEFFISFEDSEKDKLCSLLRLRFPSQFYSGEKHFLSELEGASLVREVHTYGSQVQIGGKEKNASQHAGLGRRMLEKAEKMSRDAGFKRIAVISGVGVRNYYKKWGYRLEGTYMVKDL